MNDLEKIMSLITEAQASLRRLERSVTVMVSEMKAIQADLAYLREKRG